MLRLCSSLWKRLAAGCSPGLVLSVGPHGRGARHSRRLLNGRWAQRKLYPAVARGRIRQEVTRPTESNATKESATQM